LLATLVVLARFPVDPDVGTPLRPTTTGEGAGTNYAAMVRVPEGQSLAEAAQRLPDVEASLRAQGLPADRKQGFGMVDNSRTALVFANFQAQIDDNIPSDAPGWIVERYNELTNVCAPGGAPAPAAPATEAPATNP